MILSVSYRTDIPAFYGDWFLHRMGRGFCSVVNPYNGKATRVDLTPPAVDAIVFWTRNAEPFRDGFEKLEDAGYPFVIQYTIIGYPKRIDARVIEADRAADTLLRLADRFGPSALVWRYDPVLISDLTPEDWHRERFAGLAERLKGAVDEVVCSFMQDYTKSRRNLGARAGEAPLVYRDPSRDEKIALLQGFQESASGAGMRLTLCTQPDLASAGFEAARCIDAERLSLVAGYDIEAPVRGNRAGCLCHQARDIGAYDTCPHGCRYCYAVTDPEKARARHRAASIEAAALGGEDSV